MRYIDADNLERKYMEADYMDNDTTYEVIAELDNQPTADVVEVVRCKDCKYRETNECPYDTVNYMLAGWDFCSSGERTDT